MDGWVILKSKIDNTEFDKDLKNLENKSKKTSDNKVEIEPEINSNNVERKTKEIKDKIKSSGNNKVEFEYEFDTSESYTEQIDYLKSKIDELKIAYNDVANNHKMGEQSNEAKELAQEIEKATNSLNRLKQKQSELNKSGNFEGINNSLSKIIKKVTKWGLAIFSVRSAYQFLRQTMGMVSENNKAIALQISAMKFAIANALTPLIQKIVNLAMRLMQIIDYIWFRLTGKHLFDFAKAWEDAKKSSGAVADNVKEASKQLAGFDEMNVIEDNSSKGGGAGSGIENIENPFESWEEFQPPKWLEIIIKGLEWIRDNWKIIALAIAGIGLALLGIKLFSWISGAKEAKDATTNLSGAFKGFFDGLGKAATAIAILGGIALVIHELTGFIQVFNESGMSLGEVAGLLAISLGILAGAFTVMLAAMKFLEPSWQSIAAAAIILGGFALVLHEVTALIDTFANSGLGLNDVIGIMVTIVASILALIIAITAAAVVLSSNPLALVGVLALTVALSAILIVMAETLPKILDAAGKFIKDVAPFVIVLIDTIAKGIERLIYALGTILPPIIESVGNVFTKIFDGISKVIDTVGNTLVKILNTIKSLVVTVFSSILNFINQLGPAINNFIDNLIIGVTKLINFLISGIEYLVNTLVLSAINGIISMVNKLPGVNLKGAAPFYIPRFTPRLAKGGIINQPGRGVPVGGAIAGERGSEGVIPLTDSQQMALLGEAIGRYITINANITNSMNGRVISRELQKIQNSSDFAFNR